MKRKPKFREGQIVRILNHIGGGRYEDSVALEEIQRSGWSEHEQSYLYETNGSINVRENLMRALTARERGPERKS